MLDHTAIERAIQNELSEKDRELRDRALEIERDKARGRDLDDWLLIGTYHNIRITLARRLAGSPNRNTKAYKRYLHDIMQTDGVDTNDGKMMRHLYALAWVCDEAWPDRMAILAEARDKMSAGELAALNSPHTARTKIKKLVAEKSGYEKVTKPSRLAKLVAENAELRRANESLKAERERDKKGSLFNRVDQAKDVVFVLMQSQFSNDKLKQIEDLLRAARLEQVRINRER